MSRIYSRMYVLQRECCEIWSDNCGDVKNWKLLIYEAILTRFRQWTLSWSRWLQYVSCRRSPLLTLIRFSAGCFKFLWASVKIYFYGLFLCFVFVAIVITLMLYCTFRRVGLLSFYVSLKADWFQLRFKSSDGDINLSVFGLIFICCFIFCDPLFLC
jgi:hypothetical protein